MSGIIFIYCLCDGVVLKGVQNGLPFLVEFGKTVIIHRYVPCKKWLCNIKVVASDACERCNVQDDIQHFLFACTPVKLFWSQLESWWNNVSNCPVVLTEKHVIFGIYYDLKFFSSINYVLLLGKMYVYRQKMQEKEISCKYFLHELEKKLVIEKSICEKNSQFY